MTTVGYTYLDDNADEEDYLPAPTVDDVLDGGATAWLQVAGSFCINLSIWGVINMYGVFQTYYESHTLRDESHSNIAWIGSLQSALLLITCIFFGYMRVYITFCYIELYGLDVYSMSPNLAPYILTITSSGAVFGRLLPKYLSDKYIGPMNAHTSFAIAATILAYTWLAIKNTPSLLVFNVLDGFFSGSFLTLGGPIVFALTTDPDTVGTRLGMPTGVCGVALLIGNPLAGAILDRGSWVGLHVWAATLLLAAAVFIGWARVARYEAVLRIKVCY
ncbi:MAG: hypothetical protein Q9209_005441 [Squamulea sp. 1 TL-2023]